MNNLPALVLCAVVLAAFCAWRWRESTKSLIFLVVFEGALRKWVLPSLTSELYLLKDVVIVGALAGWAASGAAANFGRHRSYLSAVAAFAVFGFLEMFNPAMASPVGGLFGLKAYVLWAGYPLLLVSAVRSREEFDRYLRAVFLVAIPICLLAVLQSRLPADSFLNVYVREADINTFGSEGAVRVTGTFPFLTGFANFLIFLSVFLVPVALYSRKVTDKVLGAVLFPLIMSTALMTGSRWPVFFLGIFVVGYFATIAGLGLGRGIVWKSLLLPAAVCALAVLLVFQSSLTAWLERAAGAQEAGDTFLGRSVGEIFYAFDPSVFTLFGDGIGSTNNAAIAATAALGLPFGSSAKLVEAEPARVMAELGVAGFLLWYGLRLFLIASLFRAVRRLHDPFLKSLAVAGGWFLLVGIMAPVPFDATLGAFYWFVGGLSIVLPHLDRTSRPAARPRPRRSVSAAPAAPILTSP